jgi:hypothetical protein
LAIALVALMSVIAPISAQEATPAAESVPLALSTAWLVDQQDAGGGFIGFSGTPDAGATVDAIFALAAADEAGVEVDLNSAVAYLESADVALVYAQTGAGQAAKLALAAVATGGDPTDVNGVNPLSLAVAGLNAQTGLYGTGPYDHAYVLLALAAAGEAIPAEAIAALEAVQIEDGSWSFDGTTTAGAGDTNTTAMAIMALVASGAGEEDSVSAAVEYLASAQVADGGFPYQPAEGALSDANSTAVVIQALIAAGEDPSSADWNNAAAALLTFQNASGAFRYQGATGDDNLFATVQAIPAVAGIPLPVVAADDESDATPIAA